MRHSKRRGAILIMAMVVLFAITAILVSAMATERAEFRNAVQRIDEERARLAAQSGVARALATLQFQPTAPVTQLDEWFTLGNQSNDLFVVGRQNFRMQIVDAASLVNLNTADQIQLENMGLSSEQIDSLLDWREEGTTPRAEGAKDEFYNTLEHPYNAKLRRMDHLDEVLLIKGFEPAVLFQTPEQQNTSGLTPQPIYSLATVDSFSPSTGSDGQARGDINTVGQGQLLQAGIPAQLAAAIILRRNTQGTFTRMGEVLSVTGMTTDAAGILLDRFQVGNLPRVEGKINVNTAREEVLMTLPDMTTDVAQAIVSRQAAGINALSELFQVPGITLQVMASIGDRLTTDSEIFIVRVEGQAGSARYPLEAVIRVDGSRAQIIKVTEPIYRNMTSLWGWAEETTNEIVLGEEE
jgi:type II secretory pathway component PulK